MTRIFALMLAVILLAGCSSAPTLNPEADNAAAPSPAVASGPSPSPSPQVTTTPTPAASEKSDEFIPLSLSDEEWDQCFTDASDYVTANLNFVKSLDLEFSDDGKSIFAFYHTELSENEVKHIGAETFAALAALSINNAVREIDETVRDIDVEAGYLLGGTFDHYDMMVDIVTANYRSAYTVYIKAGTQQMLVM